MERHNYFTNRFRKKTDNELQHIIANPTLFDSNAIQAAIWIIEERGGASEELKDVQIKIDNKQEVFQNRIENAIGIPIDTLNWRMRLLHSIIDGMLIHIGLIASFAVISLKYDFLASLIAYPVYYIFFESRYRQTPGKMVTNSVVTNSDGSAPSVKTVILRTATRYIPFEGLSCFGTPSYGWHDKWTKTYVIRKEDLGELIK